MNSKGQKYRIFEATPEVDYEWTDFISGTLRSTVYHNPARLGVWGMNRDKK